MAEFYHDRNRPDRAAQIYETVLKGPPDEWSVGVRKSLGDVYTEMGQLERALELYQEVLQMATNTDDASILGPVHEGIGDANFKLNKLDVAIQSYSTACYYCKKDNGPKSVQHLILLNNIASCHYAKGSVEEAKQIASVALDLAKKSKDPAIAELVQNLKLITDKG